jgi:hypothetical protein
LRIRSMAPPRLSSLTVHIDGFGRPSERNAMVLSGLEVALAEPRVSVKPRNAK